MALDGMIFDLDGTLVDSNAVHVEAWRRAFERFDYRIAPDRIAVEVGKGGDQLVPAILGREADRRDGKKLRAAQPEEFARLARANGLRVFPGARELLETVRRRGIRTALATSSNQEQLRINEQASGLDVSKLVDCVVHSGDIETSKPAPDLVSAAVEKLGTTAPQCAMVGDTPYDAESAKKAGVVCLALTCGGRSETDLLRAGARRAWQDPADLLAHLDDALRLASPVRMRMTREVMEGLMREALGMAREGLAGDELPIGAVLAGGDGTILARGHNELNRTGNRTAHAEMVTFSHATGRISPDMRDLILVSTLEPCVMCLGAAMEAQIDTILYALDAPADGGVDRAVPPQAPGTIMPRVVGGILAGESRALFTEWLGRPHANAEQVEFVRQLLALTEKRG